MKGKIQVHVADDHKIVIEGIIAVINTDEDIEVTGYSLTGKEVIDWFSKPENNADVLILDITMPVLDGFQVLQHFKENKINQKIIVLSSYDDVKIVQEVLHYGGKGYISKNNAGEHIVDAIKAVANGKTYYSDDIREILLQSLSGETEEGEVPDNYLIESLSEREINILKLITKEYSSAQMADELNISINTVDTYRKKLLKKLKVKNMVGLALYAVKHNIV